MRPGMTIFILFFGVALIEAVRGGKWSLVAFWLAMGVLFFLIERKGFFPTGGRRSRKRSTSSTR